MRQFLTRYKSTIPLLAVSVLVAGLLTGLNLQSSHKVEAAQGGTVSYFLKIDGITGDSTDVQYKNAIDVNSYAWSKGVPGLQQSVTVSGGGVGKVQLHDIYFTETVSKASPQLMTAAANGKHFKEAVLSVRKTGEKQNQFLTIKLSDVIVSSYRTAADNGNVPTDEFSLNFAKIDYSYTPQKADGTSDTPVTGLFDFKLNKTL